MKPYFPLLIALLLISSLMVLPISQNARAGTTAYYMTWGPSAYNSSYWTVYSKYSTTPIDCEEVQGGGDGLNQSMAASTGVYKYAQTNDYSNTTWVDPMIDGLYPDFDDIIGTLPTWNATILTVTVFAYWLGSYPQCNLYYSLDDKSSWESSGTLPSGNNQIWWNVTALEDWTPAILNNTDTWVKIRASPITGNNYYLDYLGWLITWSLPYGGTGSGEPPENPSSGNDWTFDLLAGNNLIGIFGLIGFIGMIALPAFGIWIYRNGSDDAIVTFIKLLVAFTFCFVLFLVYVNT